VAPALAFGNTAVLKMSELSPMTAHRLGELALEAGVPPGVLNLVHGTGRETGEPLCRHPDVRAISFTGSTAITLRSDAKKIPGWRKAQHFLASYPNIVIHDGADGTGDILKKMNQDAYVAAVRKAAPRGVHIYTADGGFDFSSDYNAQEDAIFPLLLAGLAARQGNLELFAVYYCARQLARINLMTLAEYEGRAAPMQPDQLASQQEALLVKRLFGSLVGYAGAAFFFGWVIVALLAGVAAWQLFSIGFDFLFAPPDPLAF
jgi:hypothetical protein